MARRAETVLERVDGHLSRGGDVVHGHHRKQRAGDARQQSVSHPIRPVLPVATDRHRRRTETGTAEHPAEVVAQIRRYAGRPEGGQHPVEGSLEQRGVVTIR